ncbi:uncharacterized protein LOC115797615 [Archocentrus centrarchus]|uniref:uncharacterized protein LOC115797615 n=1 Tax=Archocentrus centrarchus TaxID=63155 RepID=UPI0011EA00DD|nr:uncharacterized protein LOC115797615 [Archocentrus centrarchus]
MLEEKKAQGSPKKSKPSKINSSNTCNLSPGKTNQISNSNNGFNPAHRSTQSGHSPLTSDINKAFSPSLSWSWQTVDAEKSDVRIHLSTSEQRDYTEETHVRQQACRSLDSSSLAAGTLPFVVPYGWTGPSSARLKSFPLPSERCTPSPAAGPLQSPLLGGLPGSSLLIGQQAACLRLAQLKVHLALTQINNAIAVGGRTNTPAPFIPTTPPCPTAAAISLLNLLKIANTMSHPLYNPYASGKQSSTQGRYGPPSVQAERDSHRTSPRLGPGASFSSSGISSATPAKSGGAVPSLVTLPLSYRPERSKTAMDEEIERSIDMHISRAREEVRHQPVEKSSHFTSTQRDEFHSSSRDVTSYPVPSTSQRPSDVESSTSSMDWLKGFKQGTEDDSSKYYSSSASLSYQRSGDGRFNASSERERNTQSIPGLGDYDDYTVPDKPVAPKESTCPKYTSETAVNILMHFGLEKDDLEHLISYPEDQITPDNLPFILRQIRMQKAKRSATTLPSKSYCDPHPSSMSGRNRLSSSRGEGMHQDERSPIVQPSKVIDYGHIGKYTGGFGDEIGKSSSSRAGSGSGSALLMDSYDGGGHSREPLQKSTTEVKNSALVSSRDQGGSFTGFSSMRSSDPPQRLQTQPNQTSQEIFKSFSLPSKDTDIRFFKSEVSKSLLLKDSEPGRQSALKSQLSPNVVHGVHPSRPGLVLIGSSSDSQVKDQSKTQEQVSNVAEQMNKQQMQQQQPKQIIQPPPPKQQQTQQQQLIQQQQTQQRSSNNC